MRFQQSDQASILGPQLLNQIVITHRIKTRICLT
jgi:hypothetical protein